METTDIKEDKAWIAKVRNFIIVLGVGFGLGTIATNMTYTHHLMKDCETMKQFRVGSLAYTCVVK